MIHPSVERILSCASYALDHTIKPDPAGKVGASAMATLSHLLRHANLRLAQEAAVLREDIVALRALLAEVRSAFESFGSGDAASAITQALSATSAAESLSDLKPLGQAAGTLRESLYGAQRLLQGELRTRYQDDAAYLRVRRQIRDYITAQIVREADLVVPAFQGRGPRR